MLVSVLESRQQVALAARPDPTPGPRQVLVRIRRVGVCGSDIHFYEHGHIGPYVAEGLVLGHEAAGEIVALGDDVRRRAIGERVSIEPGVPCRACPTCLSGRYNLCPGMRFLGTPAIGDAPAIDGAYAEYVAIDEAFAHPVPAELSLDTAALLEPLSVALWACQQAGIGAGARVLVTGAGAIGLVCVQAALALGAETVHIRARNAHRLALAEEFGAVPIRNLDALDADALLDCTGVPSVIGHALYALARGARAVLVGAGTDELALPLMRMHTHELTVHGLFRYAGTWPAAIALAASARVDLDALVSRHYPLADVGAALAARGDDADSVRAIVTPHD